MRSGQVWWRAIARGRLGWWLLALGVVSFALGLSLGRRQGRWVARSRPASALRLSPPAVPMTPRHYDFFSSLKESDHGAAPRAGAATTPKPATTTSPASADPAPVTREVVQERSAAAAPIQEERPADLVGSNAEDEAALSRVWQRLAASSAASGAWALALARFQSAQAGRLWAAKHFAGHGLRPTVLPLKEGGVEVRLGRFTTETDANLAVALVQERFSVEGRVVAARQ